MPGPNDLRGDVRDLKTDAKNLGSDAAGAATRSADQASGTASRVVDQASAAASSVKSDASDELARLRGQVERLMSERVTPALSSAANTVEDYATRAKAAVGEHADTLSDTVKDRPLVAVGVAALAGYLIGRLMGGNTYVYPNGR